MESDRKLVAELWRILDAIDVADQFMPTAEAFRVKAQELLKERWRLGLRMEGQTLVFPVEEKTPLIKSRETKRGA